VPAQIALDTSAPKSSVQASISPQLVHRPEHLIGITTVPAAYM
jgi:hypothetical protein